MALRSFGSVGVSLALAALSCSGTDDTGDSGDGTGGSSISGGGAAGSAGSSAAGASGSGMAGSSGATGMNDPVGFQDDVWPLLLAHCAGVGCHGAGSFLPEHANADVMVAYAEAEPVADRIAGRVSGALTPIMPQNCGPAPGYGTCLSIDEVALIRAWFEQGAAF